MTLKVDGNIVERVLVDSAVVDKMTVDGNRAWPTTFTIVNAASVAFATAQGYFNTGGAGDGGSLSEDTTLKGVAISILIDDEGGSPAQLSISIEDSVSQDFFYGIVLQTENGIQRYYTATADNFDNTLNSSTRTQWRWDRQSNLFNSGNSYKCWFIDD